uniref:hypothetical protein n=1 Tax=Microbispora cellulosiformans TaxID=2614688 RepID=UPI001243FC8E|nr:hypothetical protein [Microbispora cellulosiformans]
MSPRPEDAPTDVIPVIVAGTLVPGGMPAATSRRVAPKRQVRVDGLGSVGWMLDQAGADMYSPPWRPWRRIWCWAMFGHWYTPDADACCDCGKIRPDLRGKRRRR